MLAVHGLPAYVAVRGPKYPVDGVPSDRCGRDGQSLTRSVARSEVANRKQRTCRQCTAVFSPCDVAAPGRERVFSVSRRSSAVCIQWASRNRRLRKSDNLATASNKRHHGA